MPERSDWGGAPGRRLGAPLLPLLMAAALWGAASGVPRQDSFDFGGVRRGGRLAHEFILLNKGTAPLRITGAGVTDPALGPRMPASVPLRGRARAVLELNTGQVFAARREGGRQRVVVAVHETQPAEALEEREGENRLERRVQRRF